MRRGNPSRTSEGLARTLFPNANYVDAKTQTTHPVFS